MRTQRLVTVKHHQQPKTRKSTEGKDLYGRMESLAMERGCPRRAVVMEETHIPRKHRPDLEGLGKDKA